MFPNILPAAWLFVVPALCCPTRPVVTNLPATTIDVAAAHRTSPTPGFATAHTATVSPVAHTRRVVVTSDAKPRGEAWRYLRHNGHWWYWLPGRRWAWWTGSQWKVYDSAAYARWWAGTHAAGLRPDGGGTVRTASGRQSDRWPYRVGDFGYGGFGLGGYGNSYSSRASSAFSQRSWASRSSALPSLPMGPPGGIPGAGIGYGPYGGPVGRNIPGALGNYGGANMGNPFGN